MGRVAYCFAATIARAVHLFRSVLLTERLEPANDSKSLHFLIQWTCLRNGRKL